MPLTEDGPQFVFGPGVYPGRQHLKSAGPGHRPDTVLPLPQVLANWHAPPLPHFGFVQHLTFAGSLGQKPVKDVPPEEEQEDVVIHTPGVPDAVQGPLRAALATTAVKMME